MIRRALPGEKRQRETRVGSRKDVMRTVFWTGVEDMKRLGERYTLYTRLLWGLEMKLQAAKLREDGKKAVRSSTKECRPVRENRRIHCEMSPVSKIPSPQIRGFWCWFVMRPLRGLAYRTKHAGTRLPRSPISTL